jgi:NTP pyrophosphatase (non-canonical NTP hydrolase)
MSFELPFRSFKLPKEPKIKYNGKEISIFKAAIQIFGYSHQKDMMVEECAELIQAIQKTKRYSKGYEENMFEEIADCYIVLMQLIMHNPEEINKKIIRKMKSLRLLLRTHNRIK